MDVNPLPWTSLLTAPYWPRLLMGLLLLVGAGWMAPRHRKDPLKPLVRLGWALVALAPLHALLLWFFPPAQPGLPLQWVATQPFATLTILPLLLEAAFIVAAYQSLLRAYTRARENTVLYWILVALTLGAAGAEGVLNILPFWARRLTALIPIVYFIHLAWRFSRITPDNTPRSAILGQFRDPVIRIPLLYWSLALVFGPEEPLLTGVLGPLTGFVHLFVLSRYHKLREKRQANTRQILKDNLGAVIDFMRTIGNAMTERLDTDRVLEFVVKSAVRYSGASGGCVLLIDEFEDVLRVKSVDGSFPPPYQVGNAVKNKQSNIDQFFRNTPIPLGQTILGEAAVKGRTIYLRRTAGDPRMTHNRRADIQFIASLIVVPLVLNNKVLGVLAVASNREDRLFSRNTARQLRTFGDYTSLTINNLLLTQQLIEKQEMEREVGIAAEIQGQLLPAKLPHTSSIRMAAHSLPAKGVSGDYYDLIKVRKGRVLLVICDVAGKGIPASLVMVMIRTITHLVAHQPNMHVSRIMDIVNWGIAGRIALDRFATMSLASYDFHTHELTYSNAAHHPLLIYRTRRAEFETLDSEGIPIGLEKKSKYQEVRTKLEKNDILVLYTDGIIEAMNEKGQQFGQERLEGLIREHAGATPDALKSRLIEAINGFVGKARQHDDQTFVIMKIEDEAKG